MFTVAFFFDESQKANNMYMWLPDKPISMDIFCGSEQVFHFNYSLDEIAPGRSDKEWTLRPKFNLYGRNRILSSSPWIVNVLLSSDKEFQFLLLVARVLKACLLIFSLHRRDLSIRKWLKLQKLALSLKIETLQRSCTQIPHTNLASDLRVKWPYWNNHFVRFFAWFP